MINIDLGGSWPDHITVSAWADHSDESINVTTTPEHLSRVCGELAAKLADEIVEQHG